MCVRSTGWEDSFGVGNGNPLQYSCLGKSHGQRNLEGDSPQGGKESDTTEHAQAQLLYDMWDLPGSGMEPVSPALAGRFFTTEPPGKPPNSAHF